MQRRLYVSVYGFTYSVKFRIYFAIGKAYNGQPVLFKNIAAVIVSIPSLFGVMLGTVNFDDQFGFCAVEVNNVVIDNALLIDFYGICSQKQVP